MESRGGTEQYLGSDGRWDKIKIKNHLWYLNLKPRVRKEEYRVCGQQALELLCSGTAIVDLVAAMVRLEHRFEMSFF